MQTRKNAPATAQKAAYNPLALWSSVLDLPRQQSAAATHAACAMFGGLEAMRKIQEKTTQDLLKHHTDAAQRLQQQCAPLDVLSVQMDLARFDVEAAAAWWQQLATATMQTQARVAACGAELVDSDKLLETLALFEQH